MAATATVIRGRWPAGLPDGVALVRVSPGEDYTAGGEPIADAVEAALLAHFGVAVNVSAISAPGYVAVSDCLLYSALYDELLANIEVRERPSQAVWSDAIAVAGNVGDLPDGTVAVYAVEATAGGTTGSTTILHSAAAATECNVDVDAGEVTFAAADAVTEMRVLHATGEVEVADTTDLSDAQFTFLALYTRSA